MKKNRVAAAVLLVALLTAAGCAPPAGTQEGEFVTYSSTVKSVEWVGMVTGADSPGRTDEYAVGGTDLGFPIYNSRNDTMYLAFGDTFQNASNQTGLWRSNVLAYTQDFDLSDGLTIEGFLTRGNNAAATVIEGYHVDMFEMTKIPTGGIEVNGVMYLFYFSKYSWNNAAEHSMNYGGAVKSEDNGQTWERVNDLSWLDDSVPERREEIERLANEDINMQATDAGITMETHAGYSFTQIFPVDGKDGYVYLFGEGGYRSGGIRLGRVRYENIEVFEEYEYFNGTDANGDPVWRKGSAGLAEVEANRGAYVVNDFCSEHSVMYNAYLKKWMVVYLRNNRDGIVYRTADEIWGPYGDAELLVSYSYPFENGVQSIYGGLVHEKYTSDGGKTFYLILSQWMPVYNSSLMKIVLK